MSILYIHIPFCLKKCPYCDFFSIPGADQRLKDEYTGSLIKELHSKERYLGKRISTVYFGGGSPLLLGINNLERIMTELRPRLNKNCEVTLELNPEHLCKTRAVKKSIKELGINRVSLGIQTTDQNILRRIKRHLKIRSTLNDINWFKKNGVDVSLDFMFGLTGQNISDLKKDLAFIKKAKPHHVSFYMFTVDEDYEHHELCPDEDIIIKMFKIINRDLTSLGFEHYEVSNFALPGKQSKHNKAYWEYKQYIGLGAGAHSFIKSMKKRYWNNKDINGYIDEPNGCFGFEELDAHKIRTEKIMLGLRLLKEGVNKNLVDPKKMSELLKQKLIKKHGKNILVSPGSVPMINEIIERLVP